MSNTKPLHRKSYGSIPHLPNSRMGEGDHHCTPGQAKIATEKKRDKHDTIIIQEKLDGSNVGVAKIDDLLYPLTRSGYVASTSKYLQHQIYYKWVLANYQRFDTILQNGERVCGEWLLQAHGTKYNLYHEPFVAFDIIDSSEQRLPYGEFIRRVHSEFTTPHLVSLGEPISVESAMERLGEYGFHGAVDKVEGVVYRIERKGEVEFLCKYVRPDKKDGCYLEGVTGKEPIWNCDVKKLLS